MATHSDAKPLPAINMIAKSPFLLTPPRRNSLTPLKLQTAPHETVTDRPIPIIPDTGLERMTEVDDLTLAMLRPFHQFETDIDIAQHWNYDKYYCQRRSNFLSQRTTEHGSSTPPSLGNTLDFPPLGNQVRSFPSPIVEQKEQATSIVAPMQLSRPARPPKLASHDEIWWPMNEIGGIRIHAFICTHTPAWSERLAKCFRLEELFGPELCQGLDLSALASSHVTTRLSPGNVLPVPGRSIVPAFPRRSTAAPSPFYHASVCTPIPSRRSPTKYPAERISHELAVKHLPILGAVLTQDVREIRPRDKVVIPVPYPRAWPETVRYVSSGESDFLSEAVRCNISNLGGRV